MPSITENNQKPPSQWKDRFIYTMLGLFGGLLGLHNFYLKRTGIAVFQVLCSAAWIVCIKAGAYWMLTGFLLFAAETVWVTLELFLVKREPDGDAMNDEARPVRLLLILVFWIAFIILPLLFTVMVRGTSFLTDPVTDELKPQTSNSNPEHGDPP